MVINNRVRLLIGAALILVVTSAVYLFWHRRTPPKPAQVSSTPKIQWQFKADSRIFATPAVGSDGTLYLTTYDVLYAFSPDGSEKWHYVPGNHLWRTSPVIGPDQSIYLFTVACEIHSLNPDGSKRWVAMLGDSAPGVRPPAFSTEGCDVRGTPALTRSGILFVPIQGGSLWMVDSNSGSTLQRLTSVLAGISSPAISPEGFLLQGSGTNGGTLSAVSEGGQLLWAVHGSPFSSFGSPAIAGNGNIVISDVSGYLYGFDSSGRTKWQLPGRWGAVPVIAETRVIFDGLEFQQFAAVDADGRLLWKIPIAQPSAAAIAEDGTIYLVGDLEPSHDFAFALRPDGTMKWKVPVIGTSEAGPTIAPDGTIYFVTQGAGFEQAGQVYAIKENNGGLMNHGWPKFHGNLNNDGQAAIP
jgi:outer membrane protein assembly factor BamB